MSRRSPIALNDSQLRIVLDGARLLAPGAHRSRYLDSVADELLHRVDFGDDDVRLAVQSTLDRLLGTGRVA